MRKRDLERLFESKEEAVGYIDSVIALIDDTPALFDKLFSEKNCRDYDQPIGLLGMECKRVAVLWRADTRQMPCCRLRFYAPLSEPNRRRASYDAPSGS